MVLCIHVLYLHRYYDGDDRPRKQPIISYCRLLHTAVFYLFYITYFCILKLLSSNCNVFWARSQNCENKLLASSCLSVPPSTWDNSAPTWRIFIKFDILTIFRQSIKKLLVSPKPDINNGHFTWRPIYILYHIPLSSSQNKKCFRQNCRENQNTHFMFSDFF